MRLVNISTVAVTLLVVLTSCGGSKKAGKSTATVPGNWQSTPIAIDGDSKDWPSPYPNYDSKAKLAYATSNDRKYIYITVESGDELTQMKMLKGGMVVSIDTGGGKEDPFSINYPLENNNVEMDVPQGSDGQKDGAVQFQKQLSQRIRKGIEAANQFTVDGFAGCNGGYMINQTVPCGIKLKARLDEYREIVWEVAIPVKSLFNKDSLTAADAGKQIGVCFSLKGTKAPKGQVQNANGGMNQMGGGGSRNSAAMGGAMAGGGKTSNPLEQLYSATKTRKQFSLVVQP
ncbi:hypothetical protein CJD36_012885 [Flavipsychrobacter stenotrophus]|uniref:Uncharacterized protein n=1 Tax=Flavipsychrobacter stenotrophus TaxID=2077091 RepID=A0A2S7SVB4_9BACT|nr:hypothetical protein [Flavipsychrobacter stenotrophus]PQJ10860.1 hypothetical protein CJD36_012885 [Flavipsychrobacter stenotrophus]